MDKKVVKIPAERVAYTSGRKDRILRVAAYARVSTDEERQLGSFENQIDYFTRLIGENRKYELVKVYSDEGISGCSIRSRKGFCEMIRDCEVGKIDLIITKSISRFARNTQDSLNYTRKLKGMGIGVYFEKEGINTMEASGELLLTLFSCFAQEESRSISENTAWGIRSKFQQGIPHLNTKVLMGYEKGEDGSLVIDREQAFTVRRVYRMFLEGYPLNGIARTLNLEGVPGVHEEAKWCANTISRMLRNEKYKGAVLMQKTFTADYLTKQQVVNTGQMDQYYVEDHHPAIVSTEVWEAAQEEIARRRRFREEHGLRGGGGSTVGGSAFYSKVFCELCGGSGNGRMQRRYPHGAKKPYWQCSGCGRKISEKELREQFCRAFNSLVRARKRLLAGWEALCIDGSGTPLQRIRARQMIDITACGEIFCEIPELTQVVLEEAWLQENGTVRIHFLSGEIV